MPRTANPEKRQELADIAARLFYEQGYGATGIKQLIEEAGIAKGTFYSHYRSKEEIGLAWLKTRHRQWNEWLEEKVADCPDAASKLLASFDLLRSWMIDCSFRGCAFINTMAETPAADSPLRVEVESHKRQCRRWFEELALEHFSGLSEEVARAKGSFIYILFEGALVEAQLNRAPWPIDTAREEIARQLAA